MIFNRFNLKDSLYLKVTFNTFLNIKFIYKVKVFWFFLNYFEVLLNKYIYILQKVVRRAGDA